jgi:hypothetical protein
MTHGPRRASLRELRAACDDTSLFVALPDGRHVLTGPKSQLADLWGIARGSVTNRLRTLRSAGLVSGSGQLVVDTPSVDARLEGSVVALPTPRTRQFQEAIEEQFTPARAADGTPIYLHADGRRASLRELQVAGGVRSPGTAHHHLRRIRALDSSEHPTDEPRCSPEPDKQPRVLRALPDEDPAPRGRSKLRAACVRLLDQIHPLLGHATEDEFVTLTAFATTALARCEEIERANPTCVARAQPETSDASREAPRDANASQMTRLGSRGSSDDHENEQESSQTQQMPREPKRVAPAPREAEPAPTRPASPPARPAVPAADRQFATDPLPDWDPVNAAHIVQPLTDAFRRRYRRSTTIDTDWFLHAMQQWPRSALDNAVTIISQQLDDGRPIENPGGLFAKAVHEGWLEYFPLDPTTGPPNPTRRASDSTAGVTDTAGFVLAAERRLTTMGPEVGLDVTFGELARLLRHGEAVTVIDIVAALTNSTILLSALAANRTRNGPDPSAPLRVAITEIGPAGRELAAAIDELMAQIPLSGT